MSEVNKLLDPIPLPKVVKVRQTFNNDTLNDVTGEVKRQLEALNPPIKAGDRIALTAGSRGIDHYADVTRCVAEYVKSRGGKPFIVPSMGSHGGATAAGQIEVLKGYGITEETVGAPIVSSMETVRIGETDRGLGVFIDKHAFEADGIILINRVKPHTSFRGKFESGLLKMLAIGLAKQHGAEATHFLRYENMAENIIAVGTIAIAKLNILAGVCTIENGYNHVAEVHVVNKGEILTKEPAFLESAWRRMPRIALDEIDVLVVGEIGKETSGTGMDTNIVGRFHTTAASGGPKSIKVGVLNVTDKSEGNANGMGLADFMPRRMYDRVDWDSTYVNTLTSTEPASSRMPMVLDDDKKVFQAGVKLCGQVNPADIRLVVIKSTKALDEVWMSRAAFDAAKKLGAIPVETIGDYIDLPFEKGKLAFLK
jgi:uncharacterized protein (DUF362 family)